MRTFRSFVAVCLVAGLSAATRGDDKSPELVSIVTPLLSGGDITGELVRESDLAYTVIDLKSGKESVVEKKPELKVRRNLTDADAIAATDLSSVIAWKISKLSLTTPTVTHIAKITDGTIYLTTGQKGGLGVGDKLNIYRVGDEIVDPVTKKVIARERPKIGQVVITEVQDAFSKGKLIGDMETKLIVGDEAEAPALKISVAVTPLVDVDGKESEAGIAIAEDLTTALVSKKVQVVERTALKAVFKELALQTSDLVDPASVQKLGKQLGASTVLTGKIVSDGVQSKIHIRLIRVETGEVLLAGAQTVKAGGRSGAGSVGTSSGVPITGTTGGKPAATTAATAAVMANGIAMKAPSEDKIIGEDKHEGIVHAFQDRNNGYVVKVDPKKPLIKPFTTAVYFTALQPADTACTFHVSVSVDYGKTWFQIGKIDTPDMKAAKRRDGWFVIDLASAFRKASDLEVDEIHFHFDSEGPADDVHIDNLSVVAK